MPPEENVDVSTVTGDLKGGWLVGSQHNPKLVMHHLEGHK